MRKQTFCSLIIGIVTFAVLRGPDAAQAQTKAEFDALKQQLQALQQKTDLLEKRLAKSERSVVAPRSDKTIQESYAPIVQADEHGFAIKSFDERFSLRVGGYIQADGRFFLERDHRDDFTDTFLLRRVRPILEGTVYKDFHFFIMPDFGEGKVVLQDAFIEYTHFAGAQLRVGKFREPVGLEMLQSAKDLLFVERGLPTNLVPIRDVGAQLSGIFFNGLLSYQIGIFNGTRDGASSDIDNNDDKDVAARLWLQPFGSTKIAALQGLGFGVAGTYGEENGLLPTYKTPAQETFFSYNSSAVADGDRYRIVPQLYYSWGPFGVLGEYALSNQELSNANQSARIENYAWQLAGSWVITGEPASYKGVKPHRNFGEGGLGAFEVAARYGELHVDEKAFSLGFSDPALSARSEKSFGVGLNWYLNDNVKAVLDWEHTVFDGGAPIGNRHDEDVFLTRVQLAL